jgi:hypothetical protein
MAGSVRQLDWRTPAGVGWPWTLLLAFARSCRPCADHACWIGRISSRPGLARSARRLRKAAVNQADGDRPLADGRCDAFDRAVPDVAGGQHAGCAGFEQVGFPWQGPAFGQVWAGEDEAPLVAGHRLGQPLGERLRADQDKQPIGGLCLGIAGVPVPESELLQAPCTAAVMERAGISPDRPGRRPRRPPARAAAGRIRRVSEPAAAPPRQCRSAVPRAGRSVAGRRPSGPGGAAR